MVFGCSARTNTLARQVRRIRLLHIFLGSVFAFFTIVLVFTVNFGSSLFTNTENEPSKSTETLTFSNIDKASPLPIIMSHSANENIAVRVMGESLTRDVATNGKAQAVPSTFTNKYIKAFDFTILPTGNSFTISTSWEVRGPHSNLLYVICEASETTPKPIDMEIYSIAGTELKESSSTFDLRSNSETLYLKVFRFNQGGSFELIDTSPLVTKSN